MRASAKHVKENLGQDLVVAEVGVYRGVNARELLEGLPIKRLYLIDPYQPYIDSGVDMHTAEEMDKAKVAAMGLLPESEKVTWLLMSSTVAAETLEDVAFDYVYLDGDHITSHLYQEIMVWWPRVRVGGVLGGHDITEETVKQAVVQHFKEYLYSGSDWFIRKEKEE